MKKKRVTYLALVASVSAVSCTTEMAEPGVIDWQEGDIYFTTSLSGIATSRAADMTLDRLESFQVTCFNTGDLKKDGGGTILPYFEEATFIRQQKTPSSLVTYVSSPAEGPRYWPEKDGLLRFFAYSPSRALMASGNTGFTDAGGDGYFNLNNTTTETNSSVAVGYSLGIVRVNPDISGQFDFVTAEASGERLKDFVGGVELAFRHRMSQVELQAWGAGSKYDIEIAGVRLGNPAVEGTYIFSDASDPSKTDVWHDDKVTGKVEYIYRGSDDSATPEKIYLINDTHHNTQQSAQSIMGRGGCAMVIPTVNPRWEALADPRIGQSPYTTGKMYFSILLRVTPRGGGKTLYPYPDDPDGMTVIYYAVDQSDAIITRLYPGPTEGTYFTDPALQHPYVAEEGREIKEFGWAAVPVDADWSAGQRYVYTLNYSEGLGLHDPEDPEPGKPIVFSTPVSWSVSVDTWHEAEKNDDFDPDVNVP